MLHRVANHFIMAEGIVVEGKTVEEMEREITYVAYARSTTLSRRSTTARSVSSD